MTEATEVKTTETDTKKKGEKTSGHYCPGCGKKYDGPTECVGGEFGHPPIATVPASELDGPADKHTPAPNTE